MVINYNVIDMLIVPLIASTVYHILEMFVVGIDFRFWQIESFCIYCRLAFSFLLAA